MQCTHLRRGAFGSSYSFESARICLCWLWTLQRFLIPLCKTARAPSGYMGTHEWTAFFKSRHKLLIGLRSGLGHYQCHSLLCHLFFSFFIHFTLTRLSRACCWEASSKHDAATTMLHAGDATLLSVWFLLQTWCSVWWPKSSILVSPDHRSFFQLTSEPSTCRLANYSPRCHKSGFLIATLP